MAGAFVQTRDLADSASASTVALAYASTLTAGNNLVAFVQGGDVAQTVTGVADGTNTWSVLRNLSDGPNNNTWSSAHCQNCAAGTPTVTATFSASVTNRAIVIAEVSGCQNASNIGENGSVQVDPGTGTDAVTSGTSAHASQAFVIGCTERRGGTQGAPTAGTGYTSQGTFIDFGSGASARLEYAVNVAAATTATTFTAIAADQDTLTLHIKLAETTVAPGQKSAFLGFPNRKLSTGDNR